MFTNILKPIFFKSKILNFTIKRNYLSDKSNTQRDVCVHLPGVGVGGDNFLTFFLDFWNWGAQVHIWSEISSS